MPDLTSPAAILRDIKSLLGPAGWIDGADAAPYLIDFFRRSEGPALLVARPAAVAEISELLRLCAAAGIAIVTQGGNTGMCAGAIPNAQRPTIVLSMQRMNRLISVDPVCYTATAEAGCIIQTIQEAAASVNRLFAPDWGGRGTATLGGAISTNAGGINVLRYGNTREQVLGLEAVLPDGRVWDGLRSLRKDSSGYDLKQLFIGGEGTLGIITKAVMRLHPRPTNVQTLFGAVPDLDRLMELFVAARDVLSDSLSAFELIPGSTYEMALRQNQTLRRPLDARSDWYVLIRASGNDDISARLEALFATAAEAGLLADAALASSQAQEANLWTIRDEIPAGMVLKGKMLKWDASVPIDRIIAFLHDVEATADALQPGTATYAFGHVGDGNLHLSIFPRPDTDKAGFAAMESAIDRVIWSYRGSICAEHGIGALNHGRILGQKPAIEFELMGRIRAMFDPNGLLNPGKFIDPA